MINKGVAHQGDGYVRDTKAESEEQAEFDILEALFEGSEWSEWTNERKPKN